MLILSRKLGEKVVIGDNITVTVVDIDRGKVRLGFEAPRDIQINRLELHETIHGKQQENKDAEHQEAVAPRKPIPDPEALDGKW
jgi:carbon storage regulator